MNLQASHPFVFVTEADRETILARVSRHDWARKAHDRLIASAREAVDGDLTAPDRGGRHDFCYVCPACSVSLERLGERDHRCPKCGARPSGEPFDSVALKGVHYRLGRTARTLGLAWFLTGESRFAGKVRDILLAYADRYAGYPLIQVRDRTDAPSASRVFDQTLDEAVWLVDVAWAYDLIAGDGVLSEPEREAVEARLLRPSAACVMKYDAGKSNWQSWHNAGVMAAGAALRDASLIDHAVHGKSGFLFQMRESVTADGLWYEGSTSYHFYTLTALIHLAEAARSVGIDLFGNAAYERMFSGPFRLLTPAGVSPAFHDAVPMGLPPAPYEIAFARWGRREFAWAAAQGDRTSLEALLFGKEHLEAAPHLEQSSILLPDIGFAVLRMGRGIEGTYVAMDYGPHGGGHGHCDKLNIVTHAFGQDMAPDLGRGWPYNLPQHVNYYKLSVSHNTVTVDEGTQAECAGRLAYFEDRGTWVLAGARADRAYPGVLLERRLALGGEYLLDVLRCVSSQGERDFDWVYRNHGEFSSPCRFEPEEAQPFVGRGYEYLREPSGLDSMGPVVGRWETEGAGVSLTLRADGWVRAWRAVSAGNPVDRALPALILRRRGASAVFVAVHRFGSPGSPAPLHLSLEAKRSSLTVSVCGPDVSWSDRWQLKFRGAPRLWYERMEGGQVSHGLEMA